MKWRNTSCKAFFSQIYGYISLSPSLNSLFFLYFLVRLAFWFQRFILSNFKKIHRFQISYEWDIRGFFSEYCVKHNAESFPFHGMSLFILLTLFLSWSGHWSKAYRVDTKMRPLADIYFSWHLVFSSTMQLEIRSSKIYGTALFRVR